MREKKETADIVSKQKEVLFLVSTGHTAFEISGKVDLKQRTVEKYLEILRAAYGARNTPHLIGIALRNKVIT